MDLRSLLRNKEYLKDAKRRDEKALKRRKLAKSVFIAGLDVLFVSRAGLESSRRRRLEIKKIKIKTSTSRIYIFFIILIIKFYFFSPARLFTNSELNIGCN